MFQMQVMIPNESSVLWYVIHPWDDHIENSHGLRF